MQGLLDTAIKGAIEAGNAIMAVYQSDSIDYEKKIRPISSNSCR